MSSLSKTSESKLLTVCLLIFIALQGTLGQSNAELPVLAPYKKSLFRVTIQNGNILLQQRPFLMTTDDEGHVFKATKAFSIEYGWQFLGGREWHQACNFPRMGIGMQYMRIMNRDELGYPFSLYWFYDGNFLRTKYFELTSRMGLGFAYGFNTYNPEDAIPNDIICTKLNVIAELGLGASIRLHPSLFIEPGVRFTHFSNGNTREPQKGLNVPSYSIGLRSVLRDPPGVPVKVPASKIVDRHEVLAYIAMSPRQMDFVTDNPLLHETYGLNFLMANLHLGYNYTVTRRLKLGTGVDLIYDGTNGIKEAATNGKPAKNAVPFEDKAGLSVFIGGESAIDRLSVFTSLGYMVAGTRFKSSTPAFEQRLGLKYHIYPNVFVGANVRAYHFRAAKALELNIGVRRPVKQN